MPKPIRILYCHCAFAEVLPKETKTAVLARLCEAGAPFEAVADLCELASRRAPLLKEIAEAGTARIAACHPRAVRALFDYAGAPLPEGAEVLNLRTEPAASVAERLLADAPRTGGSKDSESVRRELEAKAPGQWIPWFPVIDRARCKNCQQCLSFCLFGVYARSEGEREGKAPALEGEAPAEPLTGKGTARPEPRPPTEASPSLPRHRTVQVQRPSNCKTNCPACARVCPEVAIIFPKYKGGVISGEEVTEETLKNDAVRVDPAVLRGNAYAALRQRGKAAAQPPTPASLEMQEGKKGER